MSAYPPIGDDGPANPPNYPHDPDCDPNDATFQPAKTNRTSSLSRPATELPPWVRRGTAGPFNKGERMNKSSRIVRMDAMLMILFALAGIAWLCVIGSVLAWAARVM